MKVVKLGASITITPIGGEEIDIPSWATRMKVTETHAIVSDILNPTGSQMCLLADFEGDAGAITDRQAIKDYLRPIVGS